MADIIPNRVKQSVTGSGTTTLTLGSADAGFRALTADYPGSIKFLALIEQNGEWEISQVSHNGASVLTRHVCRQSSNADAFVDFPAGTKTLSIAPLALSYIDTAPAPSTHGAAQGYCAGETVMAPSGPGVAAGTIWSRYVFSGAAWVRQPDAQTYLSAVAGDVGVVVTGNDNYAATRGASVGKGAMAVSGYDAVSIGGGYAYTEAVEEVRASSNQVTLSVRTTDATETLLASNFGQDDYAISVWDGPTRISAKVVAFEPATGDTKEWSVEALARHTQGYAALDLIGSPSVSSAFASAGAAAWAVAVAANFTNGTVELRVTGEAAHDIVWAAVAIVVNIDYSNLA